MEWASFLQILESTIRLATPLVFACLAGLYSERAGVFDIGLEGKMLVAAFAAAAAAFATGSVWVGTLAGIGAASEGYTSTTVSYQITDRFSAQAVVEQAPGTGPLGALGGTSGSTGSTTNAGVAGGDTRARLGIDWRFADRWLMRGTVGVSSGAASGLEFLYQLRY